MSSRKYGIDPDELDEIQHALEDGLFPQWTLNDEGIFKLEQERIFNRDWIFIGHETEIPEKGDYARRYIGEDTFIFVRDENEEIQVLFDSCRHRGAKLCQAEQGNTSHFRCPYHGWTYKNNGDLVGVPQKEDAFQSLDRDDFGLHSAPRVDSHAGLVFASLSENGPSLSEHLGDFTWYLDLQLELFEGGMEVYGEPHRWTIDADWKMPAENFRGDSYHTAFAHGSITETGLGGDEAFGMAGTGETQSRHVHCNGHSTSIRMFERGNVFMTYPEEVREYITDENLSEEQFETARRSLSYTGSVFPNLAFFTLGDISNSAESDPTTIVSLRKWRPIAPGKTEVWSWNLVPKQAPEDVKERMYEVYLNGFGPSGNFEQDDVTIWEGISEVSEGTFTRTNDIQLFYQMGMDHMSDAGRDESFPGPGTVFATNLEEVNMQKLHRQWYQRVANRDEPLKEDEK